MDATRNRLGVTLVLIAAVLGLCAPVASAQSFIDRAREKAAEAKRKWDESERRCTRCGKTIHGRDVCATCLAKQVRQGAEKVAEGAKQAAERVQDGWHKSAEQRAEARRQIAALSDHLRGAWHDSREQRQRCGALLEQWALAAREGAAAVARHADHVQLVYGPRIAATAKDPEQRRQVTEALGLLTEAQRQVSQVQQDATYQSLKLAGRIPVGHRGQQRTLESVARERVLRTAPFLSDTPLVDDPAAPLAHLLVGDRAYFVNEMPLVAVDGGRVPLREALLRPVPGGMERAEKCIKVLEAADEVATALDSGEGLVKALAGAAKAIDAVSK